MKNVGHTVIELPAVVGDSDRMFCWFTSAHALMNGYSSALAQSGNCRQFPVGNFPSGCIIGCDVMKHRVTYFVSLTATQSVARHVTFVV